jgi:UDP-2,3-diacylglucosamine pyrophosphatase LpxH
MLTEATPMVDTLLVSDVHLGSRVSRAGSLLRLLRSLRESRHSWHFRQLVLLGDIFDGLNFNRLRKHAWQVMSTFREITDEESNARVVWVAGNHDYRLIELMAHLVGITVHEEYQWEVAGRRFLAMHGHQFDKWIIQYPTLSRIPGWFYDGIQALDGSSQRISRYVKEKSKKWLRINQNVADGIVKHAVALGTGIEVAFCGHTHMTEVIEFPEEGIIYYNSGCWTGKHNPNYITVTGSGQVAIHEYVEEAVVEAVPIPA